jgi:asparagine synthase (glutamine-hydrolysing)
MCAIAGIINWSGSLTSSQLSDVTKRMCDSMVHRGPDDGGAWVSASGHCALGHRRLSIIDLSAGGRQPMSDEFGSIWVSFNGEIYNFQRLREKLVAEGHCFRTNTDSEVLPHLFEEMAPAKISELDGMYAFSVWNEKERRLLLVRDPFGKKPLYYSEGPSWFAFASELQALRCVPDFDAEIDREALASYLLTGYISAPHSIFRGARKLPPGHYLEWKFSSDGKPNIFIGRHADFQPQQPTGLINKKARVEKLRDLLIEAVEKRLVSDVPLGAFLSGGVDSSLVAAIATKELGRSLKTFTIGFDGTEDTEHIHAREISAHLGTDHNEKILSPDAVSLLEEIAGRLDEPNGDSSCLPTLLLCQYAKEHVTVALSGDGGDELFGGYGRYRDTLNECGDWTHSILRQMGILKKWKASEAYLSPRWLIFQPAQVEALLGRMPLAVKEGLDGWRMQLDNKNTPLIHRMRHLDAHTYMPGAVLAKVDRMSMQVALEVRCPLLDQKIRQFAESVSQNECWAPPDETKKILKKLASDYLPMEWMQRRKLGFGLPANAWSKANILVIANDLLLGPSGVLKQIVNPDVLRELVSVQSSENNFSIYQLWPLLILEFWLRKNL